MLKKNILVGMCVFFFSLGILGLNVSIYAADTEVVLEDDTPDSSITIKGTITNIPPASSNLIHLYSFYGKELPEVGSAPVDAQGNFMFEPDDTLQQGLYRIGFDIQNAVSIVLSGGEDISIKGDYEQLKADKAKITNSKENEAYRVLLNEWNQMSEKMVRLNNKKHQVSRVDPFFTRKTGDVENEIRLLIQEHNVNLLHIKETYPDTFMSEVLVNLSLLPQQADYADLSDSYDNERAFLHDYFFELIDFADVRIIHTPFLMKKYSTYLAEYTHNTPEGFKDSADLILSRAKVNSAVQDFTIQFLIDTFNQRGHAELANYVVDNYAQGCDASLSAKTVEKIEKLKRLRVGQTAPEIVSNDPDGNTVALSSLLKKNNVSMLYFWASWCGFCKAENPNIKRMYDKFKDKGLDIYAVAMDSDKAQWLKAIKDSRSTWTNVSDLKDWGSEAAMTYNVSQIPTIYLLDEKGKIIAKNLKGDVLENKLKELLN